MNELFGLKVNDISYRQITLLIVDHLFELMPQNSGQYSD
jgi:hypothetical protein